jgi:hypothetical protein
MRRQAATQHAKARRHHINREQVRLAELQYTINILHQQEQRQEASLDHMQHQPNANHPPPPLLHNQVLHRLPPPPPPHNHFFQPLPPPLPQIGTTYPKSSLAIHLQLAPWPSHYRGTPPPKYHGNSDPRKFLISYETTIALAEGDEATLAKSLIISLEDAAANWYSRLLPKCIYY